MAKPVVGQTYLWVTCKSCQRHFRVFEDPLYQGKAVEVREPMTLKCRGCGVSGVYAPSEMRIASYHVEPRKG